LALLTPPIPLAIELNHPSLRADRSPFAAVTGGPRGRRDVALSRAADEATDNAFTRVAEELRQEVGGG
jgi:hypothetical protein